MSGTGAQQVCSNCSHVFTENFCNRCGQKVSHRITLPHVLHDLVHVFLHADRGVFPFISRLVTQPGTMALEYVQGKRKIFNPFQYLILCVGLILFLMVQSHFYEVLEAQNTANTAKFPTYFQKALADFTWALKKYSNVITFMHLPVIALFSWLFFKKRAHNYAEHFTMVVFAMSLTYTINALVLLAYIIFNIQNLGIATISFLLTIICMVITYKQFYQLRWLKALWKGIAVFCAAYVMQMLILSIGLLVYILILKSRQ
jgi:hypothetical protein